MTEHDKYLAHPALPRSLTNTSNQLGASKAVQASSLVPIGLLFEMAAGGVCRQQGYDCRTVPNDDFLINIKSKKWPPA